MKELETIVQSLTVENNQLKSVNNENVLLKEQASNKEKEVQEFKEKLVQQQAKFEELEKEQEDILVLMGDQDLQIKKYRKKLRELDQVITDSEEEEE
ncbi:hypothetical protein G6F22_007439 [Rhizopus arrhizus]|nr:hypothetical protein G6F22_007439 [Rhizopus arrhizus]